jgi:hypothetical protein
LATNQTSPRNPSPPPPTVTTSKANFKKAHKPQESLSAKAETKSNSATSSKLSAKANNYQPPISTMPTSHSPQPKTESPSLKDLKPIWITSWRRKPPVQAPIHPKI